MGKINSREKGARFERELARTFRDYGYTGSRRTAQYCGNTGDAAASGFVMGSLYPHSLDLSSVFF